MQSDDKYDKKEFQERMEQQFLNILKQQFPVDENEEEESKNPKIVSKQQDDYTAPFFMALEKQNFEIQKDVGLGQ